MSNGSRANNIVTGKGNQGRLFGSLLISTKMADTDPIEATIKPIEGKLTVERKMMLRGKDYVGIRLDQTANAVDLNIFRSKRKPREQVWSTFSKGNKPLLWQT